MSWGLEWLGLAPDADERTIKRAYAKRLRVTRPDEDPAGFQQLHEAYQAALAWLKFRDEFSPGAEVDEDVEVPLPPEADRIPEALPPERPPLSLPTATAMGSSEPAPDENEFSRTAIRKACRTSPVRAACAHPRGQLRCPRHVLWLERRQQRCRPRKSP